jgi:hypothetical protein
VFQKLALWVRDPTQSVKEQDALIALNSGNIWWKNMHKAILDHTV